MPSSNSQGQSFPKSIIFIISNEFCERFMYYGMRSKWIQLSSACSVSNFISAIFSAILVLFLTAKLGYSDDSATVLFHIFGALVYAFPILGAITADSFLGKFK